MYTIYSKYRFNNLERDNMVIRDKKWLRVAVDLYKIGNDIKKLEAKKKEIQAKLVELSKNRDSSFEGYEFKIISMRGPVKYKDIPELEGIDLDRYRGKEYSFWKLNRKYE